MAKVNKSMNGAEERLKLRQILLQHSVLKGDFVLASGKSSNLYVDCRLTTLRGEAMRLIGRLMLGLFRARGWQPQAVGGLTMGADPVACAIARESQDTPHPVNAFVVRKAGKGHGTKRYVEGLARTEGVPCVVIDDVCTTGGSTVQAIERVKAVGMEVLGVCCLVDREEGALERMTSIGCKFSALFTLRELLQE